MAEYIEKTSFIEHLKKDPLFDLVEQHGITGVVEAFPPADVQPVKHGKWTRTRENVGMGIYVGANKCSACGGITPVDVSRYNYCPACGAKMD